MLIVILPDATKHDSKQGRSIDRYKIDKISANILHCCRKQQQKILHFIPKVTHLPDHDATATLEKYVHKPVYVHTIPQSQSLIHIGKTVSDWTKIQCKQLNHHRSSPTLSLKPKITCTVHCKPCFPATANPFPSSFLDRQIKKLPHTHFTLTF
ncbi:hypothetical protein TSUD_306320 [Trifolium subterraneum]|uniref:Uncharacterized protein n=1 Tax=Trifolium subterraneum TaxID=3900 RepID=A0A2Z6LZU1_TRISU|nr:hypothetical protein TSUD_306320 [Trifolium subterraneum]